MIAVEGLLFDMISLINSKCAMRRLYIDGVSPYGKASPVHPTASLVPEEERISEQVR